MDCKEFREILDLYVDKELRAAASAEASFHLNQCSPCRIAEGELVRLRRAVKAVVSTRHPARELELAVQRLTSAKTQKSRTPGVEDHASVWSSGFRGKITLSVPVFALILFAVLSFGIFFSRLNTGRSIQPAASKNASDSQPADQVTAGVGTIEFSRFDRGGRISLKKEPR